MILVADYEIRTEYTGTDPNLHPAASAFARLIKSITNASGTFKDPDLEAEFQTWQQERKKTDGHTKKTGVRNMYGCGSNIMGSYRRNIK